MEEARQTDRRKIIHCDCDCFFVAVELLDQPYLIGKPVAVGGSPDQRGVIATANYVARSFGVRSATPSAHALRLCPELVLLRPNFERYRQISRQIRAIFLRYTDDIEVTSLDEAYLDVSKTEHYQGSATRIAEAIRTAVAGEIGITVSAGVAPNKFLAKVASDWQKPDGLTVIRPDMVVDFVRTLAVEKIPGVGPATANRLHRLGIKTAGQLQAFSRTDLIRHFGRFGSRLSEFCHGRDSRPLRQPVQSKSVSVEHTFPKDLADVPACQAVLPDLYQKLQARLQRHGTSLSAGQPDNRIAHCFVKMRFRDFKSTTVERGHHPPIEAQLKELIATAWTRGRLPVRLLGIGVRFHKAETHPDLFSGD